MKYLKKRGNLMGKRVFLLVFVMIIISLAISIKPSFSQTTTEGCCTRPGASVCTYITQSVCCGSDTDCISTYFKPGKQCEDQTDPDLVDLCTYRLGCCVSTCTTPPFDLTEVNYKASCINRTSYVTGSCSNIPECQTGCCVCLSSSGNDCDPDILEAECSDECSRIRRGYLFDKGIDSSTCLAQCNIFSLGDFNISGYVTNSYTGTVLSGIDMRIAGKSSTSDQSGFYIFTELQQGTFYLIVDNPSYNLYNRTIQLNIVKDIHINITLTPKTGGNINGTVNDQAGNRISQAIVSIPNIGIRTTDQNGYFEFLNVPYGTHTISAYKTPGYPENSVTETIDDTDPSKTVMITLTNIPQATLSGIVTNKDNNAHIPYARIYVNGIFKQEANSLGTYSFSLDTSDSGTSYSVHASASPGFNPSIPVSITLTADQQKEQNFELDPVALECVCISYPENCPRPPAENFTAQHVPGKKQVKLTWDSPQGCSAAGYYLLRDDLSEPLKFIYSIYPTLYIDDSVEWDTAYEYTLIAVYDDNVLRNSIPVYASITTGDELCEGKYIYPNTVGFTEFCVADYLRYTCDMENRLIWAGTSSENPYVNCSQISLTTFCTGPDDLGNTYCKNSAACGPVSQKALPFGLYYSKSVCESSDNFCYYDYSDTIVDRCNTCRQNMTCFDYQSQSACLTDNCNAGENTECLWSDTFFTELGKGYCYPKNITGTEYCHLCSETSPLFKNTGCTQEICSRLGDCIADAENKNCGSCADSGCEQLNTEESCIGSSPEQNFNINTTMFCSYNYIFSNDICSIGRCRWNSNTQECFKDGNADGVSDCSPAPSGTTYTACIRDTTPPKTNIQADYLILSLNSNISFYSDTYAKKLTFCIDDSNTCCPHFTKDYKDGKAQISKDDIPSGYQQGNYYIRYYSTDIHSNQELVQSSPFVVDILAPQINLKYYIIENVTQSPEIRSDIHINVTLDQEATCTDRLTDISSCTSENVCTTTFIRINTERNVLWNVSYNVPDGNYRYDITCIDDAGNIMNETIPRILVDAFRFITITYPDGPIHNTSIRFNIETIDESVCTLYNYGTIVDDFNIVPGTSYEYLSSLAHTLADNRWYPGYYVICSGDKQNFDFTIDNLAPFTTILLSGNRDLSFSTGGWEAWYYNNVTVDFVCEDTLIGGFGCNTTDTAYCISNITGSCTPNTLFVQPFSVTSTKKLCYFTPDKGGNNESMKCGIVHIDEDIGIELITPPYNASHKSPFDVLIHTLRPTRLCKYSNTPGFNFNTLITLPSIFNALDENRHKLQSFNLANPYFDMYIKCNDTNGFINDLQPANFLLEFDPTPPDITDAFALPNPVVQGNSVDLHVETDDLAICKYSRHPNNYPDMIGFPGWDEFNPDLTPGISPIFDLSNLQTIVLNAQQDDGKSHDYYVICQNRAGNISGRENITFSVNLYQSGTIISTSPSGSITDTDVTLQVVTSKDAECSFKEDVDWEYFDTTGETTHETDKFGLEEGVHHYDIRCDISQYPFNKLNGQIHFTIDLSPPVNLSVEDSNISCGNTIRPSFYAQDPSPIRFNYSLYDSASGNQSIAWTLTTSDNPSVSLSNLQKGRTYYFKVIAIDQLGHSGNMVQSDGFLYESADAAECRNDHDPPNVTLVKEVQRRNIRITINCRDNTACGDKYYQIAYDDDCSNVTEEYTKAFTLDATATICWNVSDTVGNIAIGSEKIYYNDSDGDKIHDEFDQCPNTPAGATVNEDGCSASQRFRDGDGDGVPDDRDLCPDTPLEDIYLVDEDGCSPGDITTPGPLDSDGDGVHNDIDQCPNTPYGESVDEFGCSNSQKDSDGDGMDDAWEIQQGLDPFDPADANIDSDGDGLTNKEEYDYYKSTGRYIDINKKDTDGDGFTDKQEIDAVTDPSDPNDYPKGGKVVPIILLISGIIFLLAGLLGTYMVYEKDKEEKEPALKKQVIAPMTGLPRREAPKQSSQELDQLRSLAEKREKEKERERNIKEFKKSKRERFFEKFMSGSSKKKENQEPEKKITPLGRLLDQEKFKPIRKSIEIPKTKTDFEHLAKLTEEHLTKKDQMDSLLKAAKVPKSKKKEFEKLTDFIEKRIDISNKKSPKELNEDQRKEVRDVFNQILLLNEKDVQKRTIPKLKKIVKPVKGHGSKISKKHSSSKKAKNNKTPKKNKPFKELKKISRNKK